MPLNHSSKYAELTPRQFELIGRLVVEWSNIEFLLGVLLSRLLFTPEFLGRVYTDELMASRLQSTLGKALSIHKYRYQNGVVSEELAAEIAALNTEIEQIRGKRNKFSNFCWCRSSDEEIFGSGLSAHVPPSKDLDRDSMVVTVKELEELYRKSYSVVDRLSATVKKLPSISEEENLTSASSRPPSLLLDSGEGGG